MLSSCSWNACKQHAIGCHFHPLGFMFHNSFAHTFQHYHVMFIFFVLLQHLWSSNYSSTIFNATMGSMVEQLLYLDFVCCFGSQGWHKSFNFVVKFIQCWLSWNYTKVFPCVCFHKCLQIQYYELVNNVFVNICESIIAWCPTR